MIPKANELSPSKGAINTDFAVTLGIESAGKKKINHLYKKDLFF
jgi:hypothetical protein